MSSWLGIWVSHQVASALSRTKATPSTERVGDGLLPEGDDPIDVEDVLVEHGFGRGPC
jgi:hypothetical protein